MTEIIEIQPIDGEIVITERRATSEYFITDIHESITNKFVRVEVELGPFEVTEEPNGNTTTRGSSRRGLVVWQNEEYTEIMNTWDNAMLLTKVTELLSSEATPV